MNCPSCNSNINPGESFCRVCGTRIVSQSILSNAIENNNPIQQKDSNDVLIDAYIGENADKLKKGDFSGNTFLFGVLYTLYRKMWLLSAVWFVGMLIVTIFLPTFSSIISSVVNIIISIQFKKLYLKDVVKNVEKIKSENFGKSNDELIAICAKKGGTTILPVIIYIILMVLLVITKVILNFAPEIAEKWFLKGSEVENQNSLLDNDGKIGSLSVVIPDEFETSSYNSDYYKAYSLVNSNDWCNLSMSTTYARYYDSIDDYLNGSIYYSLGDTVSPIEEKMVNNNIWKSLSVKSTNSTKYYYAIIKDDKIYDVEYVIYNDTSKACSNAHSSIINSLKFK